MRIKHQNSIMLILFISIFTNSFAAPDEINTVQLLRVFQGEDHWYRLGLALDCLGDINNDGFSDYAIGVPGANDEKGRVDVYFGHSDTDSLKKKIITSPIEASYFGYNLKNVGDLNNDGNSDVLIVSSTMSTLYCRI